MTYKLGDNVAPGQKIKTEKGWRIIKSVTTEGVRVTEGLIKFGATIYGWKSR